MSRRPLRPALVLLLLGLLTATVLGVTAGFASRKDDVPTLQKKLAECRQQFAYDREAVGVLGTWLDLTKKHKMIFLGNADFGPIIVTIAQARDFYILKYVTGKSTRAELAKALGELAKRAAASIRAVTELLTDARDARDATGLRCKKLQEQLQQAQGGGGGGSGPTFTVQPVKPTDVKNTHQGELTIDATGKSAHFESRSGARVKVDYSWEVPQTITPGKSVSITLHVQILSVTPDQPILDQMNALAPDFAQALQARWPDTPSATKTYTVPISEGYKGSSELTITIGFVSSSVTYRYKK